MFYRLGRFRPQLGSHDFEMFLDHPEAAGPMLETLEEMLKVRLSRSESEGPSRNSPTHVIPDLLPSLPSDSPDREWVTAVHDRLVDLERRLTIRLLACEYDPAPDGFLCIAATSPSIRAQVRRGDRVQAGFVALRHGGAAPRISSRVFREVCNNGSIISVADGEESAADAATVSSRLDRCFDERSFEEVARCLVESAQRPAIHARHMYDDEWRRLCAKYGQKAMEWSVEAMRLHSRNNATTWDLINAVTEVARDLPDWRERHDLEEMAGRLALLHRPVPQRAAKNEETIPV